MTLHRPTNSLFAVKKIAKAKVRSTLDQFIREIKFQMYFDHPNIVKIYGYYDDETDFYLIMEYMEGGSLFELIGRSKKISE